MGQRVLIGGTGYDLTAAPVLVGGTVYDLIKGRTLIGGTGYDIDFGRSGPTLADFVAMFASLNILGGSARNNSSTANVSVAYTSFAYPFWVFSICDGEFSVYKVTSASTMTRIYQSSVSKANVFINSSSVYISNTGEEATAVYGGTILCCTFTGYTEAEVDANIGAISKKDSAGRNASTTENVSLTVSASDTLLVAYVPSGTVARVGLSSPVGTVIYGNYTSNPSLLYVSGSTASISNNGTSARAAYGGSIIALQ